jgi:hypothetical protein
MKHPPRILPQLTSEDLSTPSLLEAIVQNQQEDYYWSDDFSPEFYAAQARAGFMAVTEMYRGQEFLLPELQHHYALLDFADLHVSRKARHILKQTSPTLHVGFSLRATWERIGSHHKQSWITPRYLHTLEAVNARQSDLHVVSVLLRLDDEITAGEIGYILGRTYTSLSGFSSRDVRYRNHGTVQLILLGTWLQKHGFAFWNLGQPYMAYKFALGAKSYTRSAFLARWYPAIDRGLVCSS